MKPRNLETTDIAEIDREEKAYPSRSAAAEPMGAESAKEEERLRGLVAQGWTTLSVILLGMNVIYILNAGMKNDFSGFNSDPGEAGLIFLNVSMAIYAVMTLMVRSFRDRWFKPFNLVLIILYTLIFIGHEVVHGWIVKDVPFGISHVLDLSHNIAGLWTIVYSLKWLRLKSAAARKPA